MRTDVQTPGYMRAPFEHPACFAFEIGVDELAYALGQDPVALRLANDTTTDPVDEAAFLVAPCRRVPARAAPSGSAGAGAAMAPGSMRGDGRHADRLGRRDRRLSRHHRAGDRAAARSTATGGVIISVGGHEMGQGIRTALANAVRRKLGVAAASR